MSGEALKEMMLRVSKDVINKSIEQFLAINGVACFCEKNDDLLMWAHYGGR